MPPAPALRPNAQQASAGCRTYACRKAFTIIEMLVTITIIGILVSFVLPAINAARASARQVECASNLRQLGTGLLAFAETNKEVLCTGSFDWRGDGVVTEIGWVADLVKSGMAPQEFRCPSNTSQISSAYIDLIDMPIADIDDPSCVDRLGSTATTQLDGTLLRNYARTISEDGHGPRTPDRIETIKKKVYEKGYNTNYAASWFLVRGAVKLDASGNVLPADPACPTDIKGCNVTEGPLSTAMIDSARLPGYTIPLLCDAKSNQVLPMDFADHLSGELMTRTIVGGPVEISTREVPTFPDGTPKHGAGGWWKVWNKESLQDYRGMYPLHRGVCNVVMADNSVKQLYDRNGDGFINNGFPGGSDFQSDELEVTPLQLGNLYSLVASGND